MSTQWNKAYVRVSVIMCDFLFVREAVAEYVKSKTAVGMHYWFTVDSLLSKLSLLVWYCAVVNFSVFVNGVSLNLMMTALVFDKMKW